VALALDPGPRHHGTMRNFLVVTALLVGANVSLADIDLKIVFPKPPPLVVVSPGIQVVPDHDHEVFVVDGHYWTRRDGAWYRAVDHRGAWVVVDGPGVPPALVKIPPGHYRRWKAGRGRGGVKAVVDPPGPGPKVIVKGRGHGKRH